MWCCTTNSRWLYHQGTQSGFRLNLKNEIPWLHSPREVQVLVLCNSSWLLFLYTNFFPSSFCILLQHALNVYFHFFLKQKLTTVTQLRKYTSFSLTINKIPQLFPDQINSLSFHSFSLTIYKIPRLFLTKLIHWLSRSVGTRRRYCKCTKPKLTDRLRIKIKKTLHKVQHIFLYSRVLSSVW